MSVEKVWFIKVNESSENFQIDKSSEEYVSLRSGGGSVGTLLSFRAEFLEELSDLIQGVVKKMKELE